jgi:tankyrase
MIDMVETTQHEQTPGFEFNEQVGALIEAAIRGNTDKARELLENDASLAGGLGGVAEEHKEHMRAADADHGWTPLHLAAHYGNLDIVKLLLDHGADIEAVSRNAIANTPISAAAWGNHLEIVGCLLDHGANVNAINRWGATALHRAVDANRKPLAELLLTRGADPTIRDNAGQTPLDIALKDDKRDLVELLS